MDYNQTNLALFTFGEHKEYQEPVLLPLRGNNAELEHVHIIERYVDQKPTENIMQSQKGHNDRLHFTVRDSFSMFRYYFCARLTDVKR